MEIKNTIAVLMTCYNRKLTTLDCLSALYQSKLPKGHFMEVFLVDDGSTDGTSEAVHNNFSDVNIIQGDGTLFWNGGMHLAWSHAIEKGHDFYLWLNDDTLLSKDAIKSLLDVQKEMKTKTGKFGVSVGSTRDGSGGVTYGGKKMVSRFKPLSFNTISPCDVPIPCDTMNGNCVLISKAAVKLLGNLDINYVHTMGDIDYGLRAKRAGIPLWVMAGFAGYCAHNVIVNSLELGRLSVIKRLQTAMTEKKFPPKAWWTLCKRHGGLLGVAYWLSPYVKAILFKRKAGLP